MLHQGREKWMKYMGGYVHMYNISSGYKGATSANKRIGQKRRQKTVAWLLCGHMFLLCGARPYVCIGWLCACGSAICFYYAALGYMFLLVGCGRGVRPYVSIMWR